MILLMLGQMVVDFGRFWESYLRMHWDLDFSAGLKPCVDEPTWRSDKLIGRIPKRGDRNVEWSVLRAYEIKGHELMRNPMTNKALHGGNVDISSPEKPPPDFF